MNTNPYRLKIYVEMEVSLTEASKEAELIFTKEQVEAEAVDSIHERVGSCFHDPDEFLLFKVLRVRSTK